MCVTATHRGTSAGAAEWRELPWSHRSAPGMSECSSNISALHLCCST